MPTPTPIASEYITGSFYDFYEIQHKFTIYAVTNDEPTPIEMQTDGRGYVIESRAENEDSFTRIISSTCRIGLVAKSSQELAAIENIALSNDDFVIVIERGTSQSYINRVNFDGGTVFLSEPQISERLNAISCGVLSETWRGKIVKDFAVDPNAVFPSVIEVTATDGIQNIINKSSEELLRTADGLLPILPIQIPEMFTQGIKLLQTNGLPSLQMFTRGEWTTESSRDGGYNAAFNYLATLVMLMPTCLKEGEESVITLTNGPAPKVISGNNPLDFYNVDRPNSTVTSEKVRTKFKSIRNVFLPILERLDLVFFYSDGYYWLVQRETLRETKPTLFKYDVENFTSNTTSPFFGSGVTSGQIERNFLPALPQIEAGGNFSFYPKARRLEQVIIPTESAELNSVSRDSRVTPREFFAKYEFQVTPNIEDIINFGSNVGGLTIPRFAIELDLYGQVTFNANSFTQAQANQVQVSLNVQIAIRDGSDFYNYDIWAQAWNPNPSAGIGSGNTVSTIPFRRGYTRFIEILVEQPPNSINGDLICQITLNTLAPANPSAAGLPGNIAPWEFFNPNLIMGFSSIFGTAKVVTISDDPNPSIFARDFADNKNNGIIMTRPTLVYDNLAGISQEFRIGSFKPGQTITPTVAGMLELFNVDTTWRRRNGGSDLFLYELWFNECQRQIEQVQQTYEGQFRAISPVYNMVTYRSKTYRWLNQIYTAKTGTTSGLLLETFPNVNLLTPVNSDAPATRDFGDSQISGGDRPGQISANIAGMFKIGVLDQDLEANETYTELLLNGLNIALFRDVQVFIVDFGGSILAEVKISQNTAKENGEVSLPIESFTPLIDISNGSSLMLSSFQAFEFLASKIDI